MFSQLELYADHSIRLQVSGYIYASLPNGEEIDEYVTRREVFIPQAAWGILIAYEVVGSSMVLPSGGIEPGEIVLIRVGDIATRYGSVYALSHETSGLILKRLELRQGRRVLVSDNPEVKVIHRISEFTRVGRAVGVVNLRGQFRFLEGQGHFVDFGTR